MSLLEHDPAYEDFLLQPKQAKKARKAPKRDLSPYDSWYDATKKPNGDRAFVLRNSRTGKEVNVQLSPPELNSLLFALGPFETKVRVF